MSSPPSIAQMAKSFFKSAAVFVAAGMPRASVEQIEQRLGTCRACEHYDPEAYAGLGRCNVCGCNMEVKSVMATEACPKGKWHAVVEKNEGVAT